MLTAEKVTWVQDIMTTQKGQSRYSGILKIYAFCWKIQQRASGPGDGAAAVTYLSMRIHPKSCHIFPLKVAATLLNSSR